MKSIALIRRVVITIGFALMALGAHADDIDLYTGGEQFTGSESNVLIVLDNSTNWSNASGWPSTQGEAELNALKTVIDTLADSVNVGVIMHTTGGSGDSGYVRFAMRPMTPTNKARLREVFDDIASTAPNAPQDKVSQSQVGDNTIEEAFRYYASLNRGVIVNDAKRDYFDNTDYYTAGGGVSTALAAKNHPATGDRVSAPASGGPLGLNAYANAAATSYTGPATATEGCAKNYIIYIGNTSLAGTSSAARLQAAATDAGITLEASDSEQVTTFNGQNSAPTAVMFDEWTRFMNKYGIASVATNPTTGAVIRNPIITYTVDVFPATPAPSSCIGDTAGGAQQVGQHYVMQSAANVGGGRCLPGTNQEQLQQALNTIFAEIQSVNSQFAAAALPVSVNARGTFENQVYIGVFRPDGKALPRWYGNLKGYKFAGYCDWDKDRKVDAGEAITDAVGNDPEACKKYCEVDGVAGFTGSDVGVNDPSLATATCAAIPSALLDGAGNPLPATVQTLPIERYDIFLSDRNGALAEDQTGGTGFIRQDAVSSWTRASDFWAFEQTLASGASDMPDGPNVERGGAAQRLRNLIEGFDGAGKPLANVAARRVYTCLGCAAGSSLGSSPFSTANATLVSNLTRTTSTYNLTTLVRSGDTVTATTSGAHTIGVGTQVALSGVAPTAYNLNPVTVDAVTANTFTFTSADLEKPIRSVSGRGATVVARAVASMALAAGVVKVYGNTLGLAAGDQVNVAGAGSAFDGVSTILSVSNDTGGDYFTYALKLPVTPATTPGSTTAGPKTYSNLSVKFHATLPQTVVVRTGNVLTANPEASRFSVGSTVTVNGVVPGDFNGTKTVVACTADSQSYCFTYTPTIAGGAKTFTPLSDTFAVNLTRATGSTTVTVALLGRTLAEAGIVNGTTVNITGTGQAQYDTAVTASAVNIGADTFEFGPVTLSPANGAGGQAAVIIGRYVPPDRLINWVLGKENGSEDENRDGIFAGWRASVHGDVLHSRPLMVNYDDPATDAVELGVIGFYGSNDGFLRAIKAGTGADDGTEFWSFIPEEFIPDPTSNDGIKRLYHNDKSILYPNSACALTPTPTKRDFFWDGVISSNSAATNLDPTLMSGKRIIYAAMRRGGRAMYALDVTNPAGNTNPASFVPTFAWKVSDQVAGFTELGQTWSEPRVVVVKAASGTKRPILVMGGGYDPSQDDLPPGSVRTSGNIGRGVYIIDPETGPAGGYVRLRPSGAGLTEYSIPADVTPVDTDNDGYIDRIYAVDSGGNVLRWTWNPSVGNPFDLSAWTFKWIAKLEGTGAEARKFLSRMTFMRVSYKTKPGYALLFGSGDREKPLANFRVDDSTSPPTCQPMALECNALYPSGYFGTAITDGFFAVYDIDDIPLSGAVPEFQYPLTISNLQPIVGPVGDQTVTAYSPDLNKQGWYLAFLNNEIKLVRSGTTYSCTRGEEKIVDLPVFSGGYVRFATNSPQFPDAQSGVCQNLGQAREYAINPLTGLASGVSDGDVFNINAFSEAIEGGGLPPSITSGVVQIGERFVKFDTRGAGGTSRDPVNAPSRRNKVYWHYRAD